MKNILLIVLMLVFQICFSQTKKDLQEKMSKTKKEIELTNKLIKETETIKVRNVDKLQLLNKKIELRKKYVEVLSDEITSLNRYIGSSQSKLANFELKLKQLKDEYSLMIYNAYKNRNTQEQLMFILSSEDFMQAYKRLKYLQQYSEHRRNQIEKIISTQDSIKYIISRSKLIVSKKLDLLEEKEQEKLRLNSEITQQSAIISNLESKKSELLASLKEKEKDANELNELIQKLIEEEKRKIAQSKTKTKEGKLISSKFDENKGRLPWPLQGVITSSFGEHPHPVLKGITVKNNGIDISTQKGAQVKSIFEGTVSKIIVIPGSNSAILVRHGDYLSVYNNLIEVAVKAGDKVLAKQVLGTVFTDSDNGKSTLQLQIWRETTKLNPEEWLAK
ncbi:MAG: peptidoglycan DD-metalloendopeptidase family protein [Bacteroidales bacterium]|nr:peptidoglycan DD-metalloendopeptidase family protein [Bacteroidales bacterium]